jgi:hypothetical protein
MRERLSDVDRKQRLRSGRNAQIEALRQHPANSVLPSIHKVVLQGSA